MTNLRLFQRLPLGTLFCVADDQFGPNGGPRVYRKVNYGHMNVVVDPWWDVVDCICVFIFNEPADGQHGIRVLPVEEQDKRVREHITSILNERERTK